MQAFTTCTTSVFQNIRKPVFVWISASHMTSITSKSLREIIFPSESDHLCLNDRQAIRHSLTADSRAWLLIQKVSIKSGGRPVSELMEEGIIKHPLDNVGMPVLRTVMGIKYGPTIRQREMMNSCIEQVPRNLMKLAVASKEE